MNLTVLIIIACIIMAGYYAGFETGCYCLNRIRLRHRVKHDYPGARTVSRMLVRSERLISTALVGSNLFVFLATLALTHSLDVAERHHAELMSTLILALPFFVFAEVIPKDLFRRTADSLVYALAPTFQISVWLFRPITGPLKLINGLLLKLLGRRREEDQRYYTRARLRYFFDESVAEGVLSPYQSTMAANIMRLREIPVARVMVPMPSVVTLASNATLEQVRAVAEKLPHRRYPVRDADTGVITGVVNVLDLLQDRETRFSILRHLRRPVFIHADFSVVDALRQLRRGGIPMGLVMDTLGETLGMLTVKDLVEEIVGELRAW